jgi:RHS repeat-associated protein
VSLNNGSTYASTSISMFFRHSGITETFAAAANQLPKYARLSTLSDRNGNTIHYYYNGSGQMTSLTDSYGATTTFTWTNGYITKIVDPTGRTYQYAQNSSGQLTSYTDPNNKTTYYTYDAYGNLTKITTAQGNVTKVAYDTGASERVTSITRLVHPTDTTGPTTSFAYSGAVSPCTGGAGWKKMVATDPNSHATTYCTDDLGRIQTVVDANGHTRSSSYTPDGYIKTLTSALSTPETFTYSADNKDNVTQIQEGSGSGAITSNLAYTDASNPYLPTSDTDAESNTTTSTYDANGNLKTLTDQLTSQNQASLTYNTNGTVATSTDADGNKTTYGYTSGNLTSVTPPTGSGLNATSLSYDSANRVTKISTIAGGTGHEVDYTYDPFDRITQAVYKNAAGTIVATINYTYDADGNLTKRVDTHGTTTYSYDGLNRLTGVTLPDSSTDTYGYDPASNLTTLQDAGGTTTYGYDPANQLTSVLDPGASTATSLSYDADGNLTHVNYPSGASVVRTYNAMDQLTEVADNYITSGGSPYANTYTYTYTGTLEHTMTDVANNVATYTYDALDRLTDAKVMNGATQVRDNAYALDGNGNILKSPVNGTATSYAYNPGNQTCWSYAGSSANPCTSAPSGAHTYSYDTDGEETSNGNGTTFAYNPLDQLTSETVSGTATNYSYYGPNQNELTADGATTLHNDILGVASTTASGNTTYYTRTTGGEQIDERTPSGTYNYLYDGNGNITGLTDSSGHLVRQYNYDPYGNNTYNVGTTANPFGFQDGYQTGDGLYHFGARYENPGDARWTQEDPLRQLTDLTQENRYTFAGNDPVNNSDGTGDTISLKQGVCLVLVTLACNNPFDHSEVARFVVEL